MGVPTFALRNADPQKFAKNNSPTKEVRPRGLEACLQPASHGPAFVLDQVLSPQTCRELMALMDPHFGSFAAGKNHHGALQVLVSSSVAKAVAHTIVPHIDIQQVQDTMMEQRINTRGPPIEQSSSSQRASVSYGGCSPSSSDHQPTPTTTTTLTCVGLNRRWRIYKYAPGGNEHFAPHIDAGFPPSDEVDGELVYDACPPHKTIVSRLTVLLYLNDDFVGGETNFYAPAANHGNSQMIASVRPVQGSCLIFPQGVGEDAVDYARQHWPLHEGSPVVEGSPKYVIRSDVLFMEEDDEQENDDPPTSSEETTTLFQYDHLVRETFRPHISSSIVDPIFLRHVESLYNPHMGVENVGPFLYSFVRFTKKRRIVEIGAGYTSLYLLRALADNQEEMTRIHKLQNEGKCRLLDWPWAAPEVVDDYCRSQSTSALLCIDNCLHQKETASGASAVARSLGLDEYLEFIQGDAFELDLPENSVDILWCDFGVGSRMGDFCRNHWKSIRPGGFLLCHSTLTNQRTREWLEAARSRGAEEVTGLPPDEYVEISLLEVS